MEIEPLTQGVSVSVVMTGPEVRKLRKEWEDSISWTKTPTVSDLIDSILEHADED